jgi:lipid-binding SYLF domain-containing protein
MRLNSVCSVAVLVFASWVLPVGAAGWNPQGETQQLEAAQATIAKFKAEDPGLQEFFRKAYAYAVFPNVGKAGFWVGGAFGRGLVFQGGNPIGRSSMKQVTFGFQIGGEDMSELLFFRDKTALDTFQSGKAEFSAQATAVVATLGAAAKTSYDNNGVAVFVHIKGGAMAEASVGGQQFAYEPGLGN